MKLTILIPHYKNGKTTAYTLSQLLKYKGYHEIEILIVDNNAGDGSLKYCAPLWGKDIWVYPYPFDRLQSHGIAFDYVMPYVKNEWVISIESDSFPIKPGWLDYYEDLINKGYDGAGSLLSLSGGEYLHPAGMLFRKSVWMEAKEFCDSIPYFYYPNMAMKEGFACHTMVRMDIATEFLQNPEDYIELSDGYKPYFIGLAKQKGEYYCPTVGPMHNGMGGNQESVHTYGKRCARTEVPTILLDKAQKIVKRIGYEPGQFFFYFQLAKGKSIFEIPTEIKWLSNRENQQQEYTLMENGFKHIWAGSSYLDMKGTEMNDVYEFKKNQIEELYNSLPEHQKIKE